MAISIGIRTKVKSHRVCDKNKIGLQPLSKMQLCYKTYKSVEIAKITCEVEEQVTSTSFEGICKSVNINFDTIFIQLYLSCTNVSNILTLTKDKGSLPTSPKLDLMLLVFVRDGDSERQGTDKLPTTPRLELMLLFLTWCKVCERQE